MDHLRFLKQTTKVTGSLKKEEDNEEDLDLEFSDQLKEYHFLL